MSIELRDRFFDLSTGAAPDDEVARYRAEVDATDAEPTTTIDGLAVSWHPTARCKAVRFVEADRIDADVRELFARPSEQAQYLAAVFVDPHELSFRTFENILPLDRLFAGVPLDLELTGREEFANEACTFGLRLPDDSRAALERLDDLDLYVRPLNAAQRGGERFIFHSALLAEALTAAVSKALPEPMLDGFSHVNPVFRCNRFEPGDANFHRHRDTPYYDASRRHVSRHTVLIYLTGGTGAPALDLVGGGSLDTIEPFTVVVFDQRYEHEGAPYLDDRKVFLRTELVFTDQDVDHDPEIGALFGKACYWTGESVFAPELARHADALYDRVAAAHWDGLAAAPAREPREPFVHKRYRGVDFVANGYDFWFPKGGGLTLTECAAITLLDYFNCKIGGTAFRARCETEVIEAEDAAWVPAFLEARRPESAVPPVDKAVLFPEPEEPDGFGGACCAFHSGGRGTLDTTRDDEVVEDFTELQDEAKEDVMPAPIVMLGEDVLLDPDKFVVEGNLVHVLGKGSPAPVNFAACQGPGLDTVDVIDTTTTVEVADFAVPPIIFTESATGYHLRFDFFRNSWMVKHEQSSVALPVIRRLTEEELEGFFDEDWEDEEDEEDEEEAEA